MGLTARSAALFCCLGLATSVVWGEEQSDAPASDPPAEVVEAEASNGEAAAGEASSEADATEGETDRAAESESNGERSAAQTESNPAPVITAEAVSAANIFDRAIEYAQARTVKIFGAGIAMEHGYATGILVSPNGRILAAHGLWVGGDRIRVVLPNGRMHMAEVVRQSEAAQIVLLQIDAQTPDFFHVVSRRLVDQGDWVLAVGNPFRVADQDEELSVNLGIISMRARIDTKRRAADMEIRTDIYLIDAITSNPGAPGGALMTADGRLAGMVGKIMESASTNTRINYAIPNDVLRQFLDGELDEAALAGDINADRELDFGFQLFRLPGPRAAAYIDRITRTGPARRAGLRRDDMILSINGEQIYTISDYDRVVSRLNPEANAVFVLKRRVDDSDELVVVQMRPVVVERSSD